ncbi:MAG: NADAR family protein [Acidimicrobiales bacterium]
MLSPEDRMEELLGHEAGGCLPDFFHFWGHTAKGTSPVGPWVLSQWWPASFVVDGTTYFHAEGFMMAAKARLFGDDSTVKSILTEENPAVAKKLGRTVSNFEEHVWAAHRYQFVVDGNVAKFSQSPLLQGYLMSTAPKVLVEASPRDRIWGIGMGANNPKAVLPSEWRGGNLLGFALVEVRERLFRVDE